jgi:hypothetical protein
MSLQSRLAALITAIGADIKDHNTRISAIEAGGGGTFTAPLDLPVSTNPSAPAGGRALIYPKNASGYDWVTKDALGNEVNITDPLKGGRGWIIPNAGSTSVTQIAIGSLTATGTATAAALSITSKQTRIRRLDYLVTAAAATAVAGWRITSPHLVRGNTPGVGGFYSRQVFGPATGVATATNRGFVGLTATTSAPTDVQPSTLVSCIGVGWDAADANMQIMHNDASGTCTKVDLTSAFIVPTIDRNGLFQLDIWCASNESKLNWSLTDLINGTTVTGDTGVSTDIPTNTTYLAERGWMSVGGTSSVIGIAFAGLYYQTESY